MPFRNEASACQGKPEAEIPVEDMDPRKFYELVVRMRRSQKEYARTRSSVSLAASRKLEREVDGEIERVERIMKERQKTLFSE